MTRIRTQIFADGRRPWPILLLLLLLLLLLIGFGWWRGTTVGPQVQVPMFYDAHYLFPRPWTLAQAAPGVSAPAPVAFFGPNRVSQFFVSEGDRLAMVELWLAGAEGAVVEVMLAAEEGMAYGGQVTLDGAENGRYYRLQFPTLEQSANQSYRLTLHAPQATADAPVVTRTIGGNRLGGALRLNEFSRPGNLELRTYAAGGFPGRWWWAAVAEQLLPERFHLRLQQYKPPLFKGYLFEGLLLSFFVLSFAFLVLARPSAVRPGQAWGWGLVAVVAGFLLWQLGSGRLLLPLLARSIPLAAMDTATAIAPPAGETRLVHDLALSLWTAERLPQARLATTEVVNGLPAIRVPADAELSYQVTIPPTAYFRAAVVGGEGEAANGQRQTRATVAFGQQVLAEMIVSEGVEWLEIDLSGLAGETGALRLLTDSDGRPPRPHDEPAESAQPLLWIMPQMMTQGDWLLADPLPAGVEVKTTAYLFGELVELVGYLLEPERPRPGEELTVILYWRLSRDSGNEHVAMQTLYPMIFVHLLDANGEIVAQHDSPPVDGTYPVADWQPGLTIVDRHELQPPSEAVDLDMNDARIAVGLYDPATLERWAVVDADGVSQADGRVLLPLPLDQPSD